ncbi:response regulator transcription factor [Bacillus carboniphilus]|uniref:Response regulator transcription factor n=1 Tax=Bacillus carboniphilus TaxID=86663 RepID=A0ABY9JPJ3_9BACI|nr:response regulator transcription factor [Bacillus carboniphilus]WLR41232.1 response regulator transcription factor [Bacillus carboniphilus]
MEKILIVEDEQSIARVLAAYLRKEEYEVKLAEDGVKALEILESFHPSLILLDVMMPEKNGWEVLNEVREKYSIPIIMITALSDTDKKLKGFNEGADDYITKPFIGEEVVARVQAMLRRTGKVLEREDVRYYGSLRFDKVSHQVYLNGVEVMCTPKDKALLLFFLEHPNQVFTREQLIEHVWGIDYEGSDRAVDLSIKRLRKSLGNWPKEEGEIKTLRGTGYQFCVCE